MTISPDSTIIVRVMEVTHMELGIVIAGFILSALALLFSMVAIVMMIAKDKSTHTVQMIPVDEEIDRANEEFLRANRKDPWASSEEAILKQQKLYNEEVEKEMPEFALDDSDKEIFSI